MAKFFVGQRVRIVWMGSVYAGRECRVVGLDAKGRTNGREFLGVLVDLPCPDPNWDYAIYEHDDLQPILPSGHQPAEYSFTELMDRCREGVCA